jgi:hypothetical protein
MVKQKGRLQQRLGHSLRPEQLLVPQQMPKCRWLLPRGWRPRPRQPPIAKLLQKPRRLSTETVGNRVNVQVLAKIAAEPEPSLEI